MEELFKQVDADQDGIISFGMYISLLLCLLGNFSYFFAVCGFFFFSKFFFPNFFSGIPSVSNSLDPDQARHFVEPGLGPNCLQRLSADDTRRQRVN